MNIPNYQTLMKPILEFYSDGQEHELQKAVQHIVEAFKLTPDERAMTTAGGQLVLDVRVSWAHTYLRQAGLLRSVRRGVSIITPRGKEALVSGEQIDNNSLSRYPEFIEFKNRKYREGNGPANTEPTQPKEDTTPDERIEIALDEYNKALADEVLQSLRALSTTNPYHFEKIVADLLKVMGYGEPTVTQRSNDGGIDAIVNEDTLGLSKIYVQAKCYAASNRVNGKELRDFVGALDMKGVSKGVFITTSFFHASAQDDLRGTQKSIILVDGNLLAELMIKYGVGVFTEKTFELKQLKSDYFQAS